MDAEALETLHQDGRDLLTPLDLTPEDVEVAAAAGQDIHLPLARLHSRLNQEEIAAIMPHVRLTPDALNGEEAKHINEKVAADALKVAELFQDDAQLFADMKAEQERLFTETVAAIREHPGLVAQAVAQAGSVDAYVKNVLRMVEAYAWRMGASGQNPVEFLRKVTLNETRAMRRAQMSQEELIGEDLAGQGHTSSEGSPDSTPGDTAASPDTMTQAAMYRSPAENIGDFVAQVRGEEPRSKPSAYVFGNAERPEAGLSGAALELSSDAVRHIDKRHPGFAGWENLEAIVSQGDCFAINPDTKTKNPGRAFALVEGDKVQAILGHVKNGKNGKRFIIETAFEGTQKGFAHWLKQKQATPIYQSAGGSPAQPKPTGGRISELNRNDLPGESVAGEAPQSNAASANPRKIQGAETQILGKGTSEPARYEVWELADVIPSHDPGNGFARRPDYPAEAQERPYHSDTGEQEKVRGNALDYQPGFVLNTDPTAGNGPPIITRDGIVLGGNSRTMTLQLVYADNAQGAEAYRQELTEKAGQFGLDADAVAGMSQPILVRVVESDMAPEEMAVKSRLYNQTSTQKLQAKAEGVSRARLLSPETLAELSADMADFESLRQFFDSPKSRGFVQSLLRDGVLTQTEIASLTDKKGLLNDQGKSLVENALRGLVVPDYDILAATPPAVLNKLDRIIPALARLKARGEGWDLTGVLVPALRLVGAAAKDNRKLEGWLGQVDLLDTDADKKRPAVQALALTLANATQKEVLARFEAFAEASGRQQKGMGMLMAQPEAAKPAPAFIKAFMRPLAAVDGKTLTDFDPAANPRHAALLWAHGHGGKGRTVAAAMANLEKTMNAKKTPAEEKAKAREMLRELADFSGAVAIYEPKLGQYFQYKPGQPLWQKHIATLYQPEHEDWVWRGSHSPDTPYNGTLAYAMWARGDSSRVDDNYAGDDYGRMWGLYTRDLPHIESFYDDIREAFEKAKKKGVLPGDMEDRYEDAEELIAELDPEDIVDTAGAWDDMDALEFLCEWVFLPKDVPGVNLTDGAITFEGYAHRQVNLGDWNESVPDMPEPNEGRVSATYSGGDGGVIELFQTAPVTSSTAFKNWFGKSKVVDEKGEPLIVYHGTGATVGDDFGFDYRFSGKNGSADGYGFYFTSDEGTAKDYQENGGSLVKAYLSLQKPMPVKQKPFSKAVLKKILKRAVEKEIEQYPDDTPDYRDSFLSNYADTSEVSFDRALNEAVGMIYEAETALEQIAEIANASGNKRATAEAVRDVTGYDSVFANGYGDKGAEGGKIYVAWFPEQVKSVENKGTWNSADPRILYQPEDGRTYPHNGKAVGQITPEVAATLRLDKPGPIVLDEVGLKHIKERHGKEIREKGFKSIESFISFVLNKYDVIYEGNKDNSYQLVVRSKNPHARVIISLQLKRTGKYYRINTAHFIRADTYKNKTPLWERAQSNHSEEPLALVSGQSGVDEKVATGSAGVNHRTLYQNKKRIIAINKPEKAHLAEVAAEMAELGAPTIKAVWMDVYDAWVALEGSHRLAAAQELGLEPEIDEVEYDKEITLADLGCDDMDDGWTVAEICDSAWERSNLTYSFGPDEEEDVLYHHGAGDKPGYRGSTRIYPESYLISLFKGADLSTLLHETGHVFFEEMERMVESGVADETLRRDYATMRDWLSAKAGQPLTVAQREQAARGFEAYLMEGKAPSENLASTFARFRRWLLKIYQSAVRLNAPLTDEVRGVFDPMISTEREIAATAARNELLDLTARELDALGITGQTRETAEGLMKRGREAAAEALEKARAENRKDRHAKYTREAWAEVREMRVYKARKALRQTPLDLNVVKEGYGEDIARELLKKLPGAARREDGMDPEIFAAEHGYENAAAMFEDVHAAPRQGDMVAELVRQKEAKHDAAYDALEQLMETKEVAIQMELVGRKLSDLLGVQSVAQEAYQRAAQAELAAMPMGRAVQTGNFLAAMRRALQQMRTALAVGDREKALLAQRRAQLNMEFARQSRQLAKSREKLERGIKRFVGMKKGDPTARYMVMDMGYRHALCTFNARLAEGRDGSTARDWLKAQEADGYEIFPDKAALFGPGKPWRTMSVTEFENLADTVGQIVTVERNKRKLLTAQGKADLDEITEDIADAIFTHKKSHAMKTVESQPAAVRALKGLHAIHTKVEALCLAVDGGKLGPAWDYIYKPITEADDRQALRFRNVKEDLNAPTLFGAYTKKELAQMGTKRELVEEIGERLTWENRIAVALNMGNAVNRERIRSGHGWTDEQVAAVLKPLTARDWNFVQSVWNYLDTFKEEAFQLEENVTGLRPRLSRRSPSP